MVSSRNTEKTEILFTLHIKQQPINESIKLYSRHINNKHELLIWLTTRQRQTLTEMYVLLRLHSLEYGQYIKNVNDYFSSRYNCVGSPIFIEFDNNEIAEDFLKVTMNSITVPHFFNNFLLIASCIMIPLMVQIIKSIVCFFLFIKNIHLRILRKKHTF